MAGNIIGLDTDGNVAMGNKNNGVEVDGNANNDIIGGPQPTFNIIPQNAISANGANGVAIDGNAHNITVSHSYIGTDLTGSHLGSDETGLDTTSATRGPASIWAPARRRTPSARPTRRCSPSSAATSATASK